MKKVLAAAVLALSLAGTAFADSAADVYKAKCKGCHGEDGKAQTKVGIKEKMIDISTAEWNGKHTDADIKKVIEEGSTENKKMKPFKDKLSAGEIDSLVTYVRGLKK
jgi:mono/diheme cytochrome c family protein